MRMVTSVATSRTVLLAQAACCLLLCIFAVLGGPADATVPLPDGRAWEMVSPLAKNGGDVVGSGRYSGGGIDQVAASGEAITYIAESSFADPAGASASQYLSTRNDAKGWSTQNITTPGIAGTIGLSDASVPYRAFSSDISLGLMLNGIPIEETATVENPPLVPNAPAGYQNFYLLSTSDNSLRALLTFKPPLSPSLPPFPPPQPAQEFYMTFEGASPDFRHIVVASDSVLATGALRNRFRPDLYEWADGVWEAVNVMKGSAAGETTPEATLGSNEGSGSHMVSDNGARVFWSDAVREAPGLFVREDGTNTVQLDEPESGLVLPEEKRDTVFQTASSDGSLAFFTSHAPLTSNANTGPPCHLCHRAGNDLYEFDVSTRTLRDLTPDSSPADPNGAEVQGVLGASADGSYVYFVAASALAGPNAEGRSPSSRDNLYMWHEAAGGLSITFVASLSGGDENGWSPYVRLRTARVTQRGNAVAFMSSAKLTAYDNRDSVTGNPDEEVYLYNATSERLTCASCNPSGARPLGPSSIPAGAQYEFRQLSGAQYEPRALSEDGTRLFFNSSDALVPRDTNGAQDVYEWENGHVYLLSGGTGEEGSEFVDASANGDDAFILSREQLVPGDTDQLVDMYDVRAPHEPGEEVAFPESPPPPPCEGESCKPGASLQLLFAPGGSAIFKGAGNIPPPAPMPVTKVKAKHPKPKPRHRAKHKRAKRSRVARRSR